MPQSGDGLSAGVLGAALAPLISVRLLAATGGSWSVSLYILAMALISFVAVLLLSETYRSDLSAPKMAEPEPAANHGPATR